MLTSYCKPLRNVLRYQSIKNQFFLVKRKIPHRSPDMAPLWLAFISLTQMVSVEKLFLILLTLV